MDHILESIEKAVTHELWHPALALALTVPDVLGQIEYPELAGPGKSTARYTRWFECWIRDHLFRFGRDGKEFPMSGNDCYKLRCAFLHVGDNIARPIEREGFHIIHPTAGNLNHMGTAGVSDEMQVALFVGVQPFCEAICLGAREWQQDILLRRPDSKVAIESILEIIGGGTTVSFTKNVGQFEVSNKMTFW